MNIKNHSLGKKLFRATLIALVSQGASITIVNSALLHYAYKLSGIATTTTVSYDSSYLIMFVAIAMYRSSKSIG